MFEFALLSCMAINIKVSHDDNASVRTTVPVKQQKPLSAKDWPPNSSICVISTGLPALLPVIVVQSTKPNPMVIECVLLAPFK